MRFTKKIVITGIIFITMIGLIGGPVLAEGNQNLTEYATAQSPWPAIGDGAGYMRFEHLGVNQGLSENSVLAIFQDQHGFLWFGTREGLNKYDGYEFEVYKADPNNPEGLSDAYITSIIETRDGVFWIGTYYDGLYRFNEEKKTFENYSPIPLDSQAVPHERINALWEDRQGNLWIGTKGGLSRYNPAQDNFFNYFHDPEDPSSLSDDDVLVIFEDQLGNLWIGTQQGLNLLNPETGVSQRFLNEKASGISQVFSIADAGTNAIWLGTWGGLVLLDTQDFVYQVYRKEAADPDSLNSDQINVVFKDRKGNLWIGFEDAGVDLVSEITPEGIHVDHFTQEDSDPYSLSHSSIRTIFEDRGGILWFGTYGGGLSKANPGTRAFGTYQHEPGNPDSLCGDIITALAFDEARRSLWIGTAGHGLDRMDLVTGEFRHYRNNPEEVYSLSSDQVYLLHIGPRGNLWVGTEDGSLLTYKAEVDGFIHFMEDEADINAESVPTAITHDSHGILWLSRANGELIQIDPISARKVIYKLETDAPPYLMDNMILTIHVDLEGIIWLGTENQGLVRFDPQRGTFVILEKDGTMKGPSHNSITNIYEDGEGNFWLGTAGGGLNRFDPLTKTFTHLTTQDGLPSNRVFGIAEDAFGFLWVSTGNGLIRFNPLSGVIKTYDAGDGLQGTTFNINAHAVSRDGAMFFGGMNGFNAFYPRMIADNEHVPPVVIRSISLYDQVLLSDISGCSASLILDHNENFLSFEFAALDYAAPNKNQYAYKMEGLNEDYVNAGSRRHADYPNLPAGQYTFRLIGSNNDGVWNTEGACVAIQIKQPFWASWWFVGLVGLLLAGSVVVGFRWRTKALENQRRELAVEVFDRTQEIERRRQIAAGLSDVVRMLNSARSLDEILDFITKQAIGLTAASKAAVFERQGNWVVVKACYPEGKTYSLDLQDPNSSSARCLLDSIFKERLLIYSRINPKTMESDTQWELVFGEYRTVICSPLVVEENVYGGLVLYYSEERTFSPEEIKLAHTLADQASLAIANENLRAKAEDAAVTAERNRLARELHDAVTQTLFSTSLIAEVLPKLWEKNPSEARKRLEELRQLARGALAEMRTLLMELRPSALAEADPVELFKHLTNAFTGRTGVPVQFDLTREGSCEIPLPVKKVFYRVAQEGLNNVLKHADASQVWFSFVWGQEQIGLTIRDNGTGFDPKQIQPGHLGLEIMNERAASIHADLILTSRPGEGTTLQLIWHP